MDILKLSIVQFSRAAGGRPARGLIAIMEHYWRPRVLITRDWREERMPSRKDQTADLIHDTLTSLGLSVNEWFVAVDVGKPVGRASFRSYVGVEVEHLPSGRTFKKSEKGAFTKREARCCAIRLITELFSDQN